MDEPMLDSEYLKKLKPTFLQLITQFIKPFNVMYVFHNYNADILTEKDLDYIAAETKNHGPIAGSTLLFERLVLYKGWYPCLLKVLCDRGVCLSHVAQGMEELKGLLDDEILQEESDDQSENNEQRLSGLSLFTSGMTRVLYVPPSTTYLNKLKVDPLLERKLLKKKIELEKLQKELNEVKQSLRELNQSYEELRQQTNSDLSSDVDITEKQQEQCKDCKEKLKQNEKLNNELKQAKVVQCDLKSSNEELLLEKEKQKTELDKATEMYNVLKVTHEELLHVKEKHKTELDKLMEMYNELKNSYEELQQSKEKQKTELDKATEMYNELKKSYEELQQSKEKQKTELDKATEMYNELKVTYEELLHVKEKQKTELEKVTEMNNELKMSHEELLHVKEKQKTELDKVKEMHKELKVSYKEQLQLNETIQKENADIKEQLNLAKKANEELMRKVFKDLNLLIVGGVGAGKSALGNSILGRKAFELHHNYRTRVTNDYQIEYGEYKNRKLMVVDKLGSYTKFDEPFRDLKKLSEQIRQALTMQFQGYSALIYVINYGRRFTKENQDFFKALKTILAILGDNCIKQFGILAVTYGDYFELESEETNITFEEWCSEQEGPLKSLMEEFEQRVVLFDNRTRSETEKIRQMDQLIALVDCLPAKRSTFTAKDLSLSS